MIKFYKAVRNCFAIGFLILLVQSCKKDISADKAQNGNNEYFIDQKQATNVAKDFSKNLINVNSKAVNSTAATTLGMPNKIAEDVIPVKGTDGSNAYYIINYKGGGFSIISADKRTMSIMAYSETGNFKTDRIPEGVNQWLYSAKKLVDSVRKVNIKYTGQDTISRNLMLKATNGRTTNGLATNGYLPPKEPIDPDNCPGTYEEHGPLVATLWNQSNDIYGGYYNGNCPALACGPNGHAYTGCTTTAIAQIVKYHQFPNSYDYSLMANDYSTAETQRLMGNIFNMTIESFDCDGSSSTMDRTGNTLRSLGYYSTQKLTYSGTSNYLVVEDELRANRPVIFSGGHQGSWFIFPVYEGGHEWICDGFRSGENCNYSTLFFHMNWGWAGQYNGWYGIGGFNPAGFDFNYKNDIIIGIHP